MSASDVDAQRRSLWWHLFRLAATIRGQILLAFLVMTGITATVGIHASYHIERGGTLVAETYDRSLMAINYARALDEFALCGLHFGMTTSQTSFTTSGTRGLATSGLAGRRSRNRADRSHRAAENAAARAQAPRACDKGGAAKGWRRSETPGCRNGSPSGSRGDR